MADWVIVINRPIDGEPAEWPGVSDVYVVGPYSTQLEANDGMRYDVPFVDRPYAVCRELREAVPSNVLTDARIGNLIRALKLDSTMETADKGKVFEALLAISPGIGRLPSALPNGSDGDTPEEVVALALDYYGV